MLPGRFYWRFYWIMNNKWQWKEFHDNSKSVPNKALFDNFDQFWMFLNSKSRERLHHHRFSYLGFTNFRWQSFKLLKNKYEDLPKHWELTFLQTFSLRTQIHPWFFFCYFRWSSSDFLHDFCTITFWFGLFDSWNKIQSNSGETVTLKLSFMILMPVIKFSVF